MAPLTLAAPLALWLACTCRSPSDATPSDATWEVYALEYGHSPRYRSSQLVLGAPSEERRPMAWMAWVLRREDMVVLVDTGFADAHRAEEWGIERFRPVQDALTELDLKPGDVDEVLITHGHWDHVGNLAPFASARVHVQAETLSWMRSRVDQDVPEKSGVRWDDLSAVEAVGPRLMVDEGDVLVSPGLELVRMGGHTPGIQYVRVATRSGTLCLASDIAYLFENLETGTPPGGSADPEADRAAIAAMNATCDAVIPGHDPEVFTRFSAPSSRVVRLD